MDLRPKNKCLVQVNEAINAVMFSGKYAGRAVYLTFDIKEAKDLADLLRIPEQSIEDVCARAVSKQLEKDRNPFLTVTREALDWVEEGMIGAPPFLALLHVLSHAAELMTNDGEYAANAYYPRLESLTGIPAQTLRANGKQTDLFWQLFETWLVENDYELGRPTASAKGTWKYVGLAMSQAIVRSADRAALHELFETYGFSSGEGLTAADIYPYIDDWVRTSGSTLRLRKAWEKKDLRERVCEIALDELRDWSVTALSTPSRSAKEQSIRLLLVAQVLPSFPQKKLSTYIGRSGELSQALIDLKDEFGNVYGVSNSIFGAFATVSPNPMGRANFGLARNFSVSGSGYKLRWVSGLIIPLVKSSEGPYWIQIARVSIGIDHIVLVRNNRLLVERLEEFLAANSTGKASYLTSEELDGVPEGWRLYKDVQINRFPDWEVSTDLEPLVPLSDNLGFSITGGLELVRSIWHSKSPPEVNLITNSAPTRVEAHCSSARGLRLTREVRSDSEACKLAMVGLNDASYTLRGFTADKLVAETLIALRSAERPRPLDRQSTGQLTYTTIFSANELPPESSVCAVRGNMVSPKPTKIESITRTKMQETVQIPFGNDLIEEGESDFVDEDEEHVKPESCAGRGYHIWICESPPRQVSLSTPLKMECKDCHLSVISRNRGKKKSAVEKNVNPIRNNQAVKNIVKRGNWEAQSSNLCIDFDLIFDALCFLGSGTWGIIDKLLVGEDIPPWVIREMAVAWSSLGLIDVAYAQGTNRPIKWSVPPPAICVTAEGEGYFSGYRCDPLIELALEVVKGLGGSVIKIDRDFAPCYLGFTNVNFRDFSNRIKPLEDPIGRTFFIVEQPAIDLVRAARLVQGLDASILPISIGKPLRNLQRFDVVNARWRRIEALSGEGAYRFDHAGRIYVYRTPDGREITGPHQVIKLLAARNCGKRLHDYNEESRQFSSIRGVEPVGLLARALVACSGQLPRYDGRGTIIYENVPAEVGHAVMYHLYERELT